jgi:hypothetical protein
MNRQTVFVSLGAFLAVQALASAPSGATDYSAPLSQAAAAFKARFAERDSVCRQMSALQLGLSADRAATFCACQLDVLARNGTPEELAVFTAATFGTGDEKDAATARAIEVMMRILPERKRVCGY